MSTVFSELAVPATLPTIGGGPVPHRTVFLRRDVAAAMTVSILAHASFALAWYRPATELPQVPAFNRVEVSLYSPPAPKIVQPKPKPLLRPTAEPEPLAAEVPQVPQEQKAQDKDEPLVEARYNVETLHNPKPSYPLAARRRNQEGRVLLTVLVRADGTCGEARLKKTSGFELLDGSALKTVRQWRFVPARRGSDTVDSWVDVPVVFRLDDAA